MSNHLVKNKSEKEENVGIKFYKSRGKVVVGCSIISFAEKDVISFAKRQLDRELDNNG